MAKGLLKRVPGTSLFVRRKTGGTDESRYCYSVWMRHLSFYNQFCNDIPKQVAELGPGDSVGTGLAALLSGAECITALDVVQCGNTQRNLKTFDELVVLFEQRTDIPGDVEYPKVRPTLREYVFPGHLLADSALRRSMAPGRLRQIRHEIQHIDNPENQFIRSCVPWNNAAVIQKGSLDFVFSQAVLEHVRDLQNTYFTMWQWLRDGGVMSHTIDYQSHAITKSWNGHWTLSDWQWQVATGKNSLSYINREPHSTHVSLVQKNGFEVVAEIVSRSGNSFHRSDLAQRFSVLDESDLITSGSYMLAKKKQSSFAS